MILTMSPAYTDRCGDGTFAKKAKSSGGKHSGAEKVIEDILIR